MLKPPQRLAVVHPLPSAINAVLVGVLALIAGGTPVTALTMAIAMLGFQFSIGAMNDIADIERDRLGAKSKPIPAGSVSRRTALGIVAIGGLVGLAISASYGLAVLVIGAAGYACGLAYDLVLRSRGLGWVAFSAAFPLLLSWSWMAAAGVLPPGWPFLLPVAAIAGPAVHLANSLVDMEPDTRAGSTSLATQLGPRRAPPVLTTLETTVYALAWIWLMLSGESQALVLAVALAATLAAGVGVALSWQASVGAREAGWLLQAGALALMSAAWVAAIAAT